MDENSSHRQGRASLPSIDRLLKTPVIVALAETYGHAPARAAARETISHARCELAGGRAPDVSVSAMASAVANLLERAMTPTLRPVFNLTGTVLHTNLGRAPLPREALAAVVAVARGASSLEFDLVTGKRGDRDSHLDALLTKLTGAEAATVVNNNAAAVLLVLSALASRKEVIVSRGELIEIGGAFRLPDIMMRAGCRLCEVGATNRTRETDYQHAIGQRTGALMSVHASNYAITGFTSAVDEARIAAVAHEAHLPYIVDLGAGALVDFRPYGLPHEPTVAETIAAGADIVTFSGDKLLGGPQAGLIAGRRELIDRIKRHPLKRALRCDKMTIAALEAVLRLHLDPDRLARRLPALVLLTRSREDIEAQAERVAPLLKAKLGASVSISVVPCKSQIGSGSLPVELLPSAAVVIRQSGRQKSAGAWLNALARAFRQLPIPVVGRIQDHAFILDLRCLEDERAFAAQLVHLDVAELSR